MALVLWLGDDSCKWYVQLAAVWNCYLPLALCIYNFNYYYFFCPFFFVFFFNLVSLNSNGMVDDISVS